MSTQEVVVIIPAREGSKRIPGKNVKSFLGKPLIAYTIEQALSLPYVQRVIVDTDSAKIAKLAQQYGAEVPFLRPGHLADDKSKVVDSLLYFLGRLKKEEQYQPSHVILLQTTSPLREVGDIDRCWKMSQETKATTVLTVCSSHPRLYRVKDNHDLQLVNGSEKMSTNTQAWPNGYILNGCFVYIIDAKALLKEKSVITKKTKAVICPKWRSVDLDTPEEWVMAEVLYKNKSAIKSRLKKMNATESL